MFDFVAIFIEAIILFILALLIRNFELFFALLSILFIFDAIWVASTYLTDTGEGEKSPPLKLWLMINLGATALIFVSIWSNLLNWGTLFPSSAARDIAVVAVVSMRSILDYSLLWNFYYPPAGRDASSIASSLSGPPEKGGDTPSEKG